jgi:hypothetical protein
VCRVTDRFILWACHTRVWNSPTLKTVVGCNEQRSFRHVSILPAQPYQDRRGRDRKGGPTLVLEPKSAQSLAMVLHELTTNAVKYGALSVPSGRLRVEWSRGEAEIVIRWSEADGPPVKPPSHQGFGTRLVGPLVETGLEGKLRYDWNSCWNVLAKCAVGRAPASLC